MLIFFLYKLQQCSHQAQRAPLYFSVFSEGFYWKSDPRPISELREASAESQCNQTALTEFFVLTDKQHLSAQITDIFFSFAVRKLLFN